MNTKQMCRQSKEDVHQQIGFQIFFVHRSQRIMQKPRHTKPCLPVCVESRSEISVKMQVQACFPVDDSRSRSEQSRAMNIKFPLSIKANSKASSQSFSWFRQLVKSRGKNNAHRHIIQGEPASAEPTRTIDIQSKLPGRAFQVN